MYFHSIKTEATTNLLRKGFCGVTSIRAESELAFPLWHFYYIVILEIHKSMTYILSI